MSGDESYAREEDRVNGKRKKVMPVIKSFEFSYILGLVRIVLLSFPPGILYLRKAYPFQKQLHGMSLE